ncbi:MAG: 16S rRNA (uracil(1498)-N(3))-methyltransferase [Acidimicrobiaceae bacterium]|nr:16S rRNA (uracil(1498)-N(3))-methyltransferase [Acidimicrobiaceae bacterium]
MATPDLRMQPGPHVFVDNLDVPILSSDDRHHLSRSLRLRHDDPLTLSDARGKWRAAAFGDSIEPTGPVYEVDAAPYRLGLGIALTKATKPEFAVQKATEIGIDEVVVFPAEHSVARWDESKRVRNQQRLLKVAREAAMQSRRVRIPTVEVVENLGSLVGRRGLARADFGGIPMNSGHRFILIGPEGGWSDRERAMVPAVVDLGPTVLRAETAAVVASAFLVNSLVRCD